MQTFPVSPIATSLWLTSICRNSHDRRPTEAEIVAPQHGRDPAACYATVDREVKICKRIGVSRGWSSSRDTIKWSSSAAHRAENVLLARVRPLLQPLIWHGLANGELHPPYETKGDEAESDAPRKL